MLISRALYNNSNLQGVTVVTYSYIVMKVFVMKFMIKHNLINTVQTYKEWVRKVQF